MAIAAKPTNYSVNTGATYCPDHLWMLDEGTGSSTSDQGKTGGKSMSHTGPDWASDATHGWCLDYVRANGDYSSADFTTGFPSTSVTAYAVVRVASAQTNIGVIIGFGDNGETGTYADLGYSNTGAPRCGAHGDTDGYRQWGSDIDDGATFYLVSAKIDNVSDDVWIGVNGAAYLTNTGGVNLSFGSGTGYDQIRLGMHVPGFAADNANMRLVAAWIYLDTLHSNTDFSNVYNSEDPWTAIGITEVTGDRKILFVR